MPKKEAVEEVQDYSKNARTVAALADERWEMGKTYTQMVTPRKGPSAGEELTCKMKVGRKGFTDHNGKLWPSPTALTTAFVRNECGVSDGTRRPASHFFGIEVPRDQKRDTRGSGGTQEVSKAKAKAKAKAPKAKEKKTTPTAKAKVKAPKAKEKKTAPKTKKELKKTIEAIQKSAGVEDISAEDFIPDIPAVIEKF